MFLNPANLNRQTRSGAMASSQQQDEPPITDLQNICRICLSSSGNGPFFFPLSQDVKRILESMFGLKVSGRNCLE